MSPPFSFDNVVEVPLPKHYREILCNDFGEPFKEDSVLKIQYMPLTPKPQNWRPQPRSFSKPNQPDWPQPNRLTRIKNWIASFSWKNIVAYRERQKKERDRLYVSSIFKW